MPLFAYSGLFLHKHALLSPCTVEFAIRFPRETYTPQLIRHSDYAMQLLLWVFECLPRELIFETATALFCSVDNDISVLLNALLRAANTNCKLFPSLQFAAHSHVCRERPYSFGPSIGGPDPFAKRPGRESSSQKMCRKNAQTVGRWCIRFLCRPS